MTQQQIPKGWKKVKLGELVKFRGGGTPSKAVEDYWNGSIPWATVKDFTTERISRTLDSITEEGAKNSATAVIPAGHIIMVTRMAVGKVAINEVKLAINQDLKAVEPIKSFDLLFMFYTLSSVTNRIEKQATGSTVKGISINFLNKIPVLLPPLEEQERIGGILSKAQRLIQLRKEALERVTLLAPSLFQKMFGKNNSEHAKWPTKKLEEVGQIVSGGTPNTTNPDYWDGNIFWATPTEVVALNNKIINSTKKKITPEGLKNSSAVLLPRGSLLVCTRATVGNLAIAGHEMATNQGFKSIILQEGISTDYVYYYLRSKKANFKRLASGSTFPEISKKDFSKFPILVPPFERQKQFSQRVRQIETLKEKCEKELNQQKLLFKSLEQRAFRGEL